MKTGVIFISRKGTTEKVAELISEKIGENVSLIDLKKTRKIELDSFDRLILGTPIYAGQGNKKMKKFCINNSSYLLSKPLGLYVCGMETDKEKQLQELNNAFPSNLIQKAEFKAFLGGEFVFEKMNFFERVIIKKISKIDKSVSRIDNEGIDKFVKDFLL